MKNLSSLWQKKLLPHFLIIDSTSGQSAQEQIEQKLKDLLVNIYQFKSSSQIENHPDIIWFEPQNKNYTVEEAEELPRQMNYRSFQGSTRFIVVTRADKLSPTIQNKWLKTLEEIPKDTFFILINAYHAPLLPTILSRAQILHYHHQNGGEKNLLKLREWQEKMQAGQGLSHFLDWAKENDQEWQQLLFELSYFVSTHHDRALPLQDFLDWAQWRTESLAFHPPLQTQGTLLWGHLTRHVFPRI